MAAHAGAEARRDPGARGGRDDARKDELARALTLEEGKTLGESRGEVQKAINNLEFQSGEGRRLNGETVPSELPSTFCWTQREPLGVVALVTPWNFPVAIPVWKLAPALVCGNTVVLKPASITPWMRQDHRRDLHRGGAAARACSTWCSARARRWGRRWSTHPDVAAISFTGSNEVGAKLYADGARAIKKVQCEMGGKNPVIVLEDADLELAATATVQGAFGSTGQRCTATSRAIVVVVGGGGVHAAGRREGARAQGRRRHARRASTSGPCVDEGQFSTVMSYLEIGKREAKLALGGERVGDKGFFVAPTVFAGVKRDMRIAQEEVFGPVLAIIEVKDFDEAMRRRQRREVRPDLVDLHARRRRASSSISSRSRPASPTSTRPPSVARRSCRSAA